jgi:uncharacterized protein YehS (DUF1456 family)
MNNNDILRSIRFTFDFSDNRMIDLFALGGLPVTRATISSFLKRDDDPDFKSLHDDDLARFLNGLIIQNRGEREGDQPKPEKTLTNNMILRKLKTALNLKDDEILDILRLVDRNLSKHELSAFFRNPTQPQYRACKDQVLRNFLQGIQLRYRPEKPS